MTLRRVLVGERINQPSGAQIRKKLRQSRTAEGFKMRPGFIYTVVRAISARINQNYDGWPAEELKKSAHTFIGKPVFVNHENYDPKLARGVVVASRFIENGNDRYIEVIQEIDASRFPKLAHEIKTGGLDSVSMGAEAAFTICSYCRHRATDESDMCEHVRFHKGDRLRKFDRRTGKVEDILVFESCHKLSFFELSYVFDPADETAVASKVLVANKLKEVIPDLPVEYGTPERKIIDAASSLFHDPSGRYMGPMKTRTSYPPSPYGDSDHCPECGLHFTQGHAPGCPVASKWGKKMSFEQQVLATAGYRVAWGETEAPPEVDTLREEGSAPEDDNDDYHHYVEPSEKDFSNYNESPEELSTPDLEAAGNIDREQDQQQATAGGVPGQPVAPGQPVQPGQQPPQQPQPQQQFMTLQIPLPPEQQQGLGATPMQAFSAVAVPRTTVAYFNEYFGTDVENVALQNGHGVSGNSRNPRKGSTMGRNSSTLAERGKVASRGRSQHFAEGPYTDAGDQSRNDQGEQEEAFITETPPPEPVDMPTDDEPNITNTENNLVAAVQRGRQQLLKDAQALAAMQARKRNGGKQRTAEAVENPDEYNPTVNTGPEAEALTGDDFESLGEAPTETQPKDASLHAFKAFDSWLHKATGRQAKDLTEIGIKRAATEYAKRSETDPKALFPALGIVLRQARKNEAAIKAAAAKKGAQMRKRAVDLEVAAPDGRVDVEAPVADTTDEEAQASQFDLHDFGKNAGDDIADPDLNVDSQIWAPGEGEKKSSRAPQTQKKPVRAGGILAVRCAEAYINAGLEPNTQERKYELVGLFEGMNRGAVQRDIALLERVASVQTQQRQKVASGRTRGAATPIPQGLTQGGSRRSASTRRTSANDPVNDSLLFG